MRRVVDHALYTDKLFFMGTEIPDFFVLMGHALYSYRPLVDDIYHLLNLWVNHKISTLNFVALRAFNA
jgi:hypothetical protein